MKEMTIEQLVLSMFNSIIYPISNEEFRTLGISKFNIIKRRKFRNIYGTLLIYLIRLSIPLTFREYSQELLESFNKCLKIAYKDHPEILTRMEDRIKKFEELTEKNDNEPFLNLSLNITEMFEQSHKKLIYATQLNRMINSLFFNYLTIGKEIKIKK